MRTNPGAAAVLAMVVAATGATPSAQRAGSGGLSATVPFVLDHGRMTIEVEFRRSDGGVRRARAWVDTGGTALVLAEPLARDLGLDVPALPPSGGERAVSTKSLAPPMRVGGVSLDTEGLAVQVFPARVSRPGVQAESTLPARALRHLHVVFDYQARQLTVARPGVLKPRGTLVPCRVNTETGLFMIDVEIEGQTVALGVDTGSAGTWVTDTLTTRWLARHVEWSQATGAAGSTNFFGFDVETRGVLLRLPGLNVGGWRVTDAAVLGLDQSLFDWYSRKSAGPAAGFLGANVLARFRIEVDLPGQKTYWQAGPAPRAADLDIVGLTLRAESDGSFAVAGVVTKNGQSTVPGVLAGDTLLRVDALEATGAPMGAVAQALRGAPGDVRTLVLRRAGRQVTVRARVAQLP
jgi:predicted aspartyl protease